MPEEGGVGRFVKTIGGRRRSRLLYIKISTFDHLTRYNPSRANAHARFDCQVMLNLDQSYTISSPLLEG